MLLHLSLTRRGAAAGREKKKRDRERDRKRRRHDREESETEGVRGETMRQGDRDRVGEGGRRGGGGLVGLVGKGNRQPVYYQGSIEKHLGTNRTPPPCHPVPFSPCQPRPFSQTPGGSGRGDRGEEAGSGWWGGAEDGVPWYLPSIMLQMCNLATALWV